MLLRSLLSICLVLYCSQRAGILISWLWNNSTDEATDVVPFIDYSLPSNEMKIREMLEIAVEGKSLECLTTPPMEMDQNHEELSVDLKMSKEQAKLIRENIESNIDSIVAQMDEAAIRYNQSFEKLLKINETIHSLWHGIESMLSEVDEKLEWIHELVGDKSEQLNRAYRIFHHIIYLLGAMIIAAFLQAPLTTRVAIIGIIPLNFMTFLKHGTEEVYLDFTSMTVLICLITGLNIFMRYLQSEETRVSKKTSTKARREFIPELFAIVKKGCMPTLVSVIPWFGSTLKEDLENLPSYCENNQWRTSTHLEKIEKNETLVEKIRFGSRSADEITTIGQPLKEAPGNLPSHCEKKDLSIGVNTTKKEASDQIKLLGSSLSDGISEQPSKDVPKNLPLDSETKNLIKLENITKNETLDRKKQHKGNLVDEISPGSGQPLKKLSENQPSYSETKTLGKIPDIEISNVKKQVEGSLVDGTVCLKQSSEEAVQNLVSSPLQEITKKETLNETKPPPPISVKLSVKVDNRTDDKNSARSVQYGFNPTLSLHSDTLLDSFAYNVNAQPVSRSISYSDPFQFSLQRCESPRYSRQSGICGAMTQKGTPCRNKPSYGGPTCWRH